MEIIGGALALLALFSGHYARRQAPALRLWIWWGLATVVRLGYALLLLLLPWFGPQRLAPTAQRWGFWAGAGVLLLCWLLGTVFIHASTGRERRLPAATGHGKGRWELCGEIAFFYLAFLLSLASFGSELGLIGTSPDPATATLAVGL